MSTLSVSASFARVLDVAHEAAGHQDYPCAALYVVATPIGNLSDISLRALHVLGLVEAIACEDTRHTQHLLRAYGIHKTSQQLLAVHQHNEQESTTHLIKRLQQGQRVAYVSDAGTPAVSDPGARLVEAVRQAGLRCVPIPGVSSVTAALSVAGVVPTQDDAPGFVFHGFLPTRANERSQCLQQLAQERRAVVLLEAPHRIADLVHSLSSLGERLITLGRELTKQFEEIATLPAHEAPAWLQVQPQRSKGEFVVVVHPPTHADVSDAHDTDRVLSLLLAELPLKTAVRLCTDITGAGRNEVYQKALALKNNSES